MSPLEQARAIHAPDGEPPLPYPRWRDLAPRLVALSPDERAAVLSRAGIEAHEWTAADGFWSLTLTAEAARGDLTLAHDFGRACAEELATRAPSAEPPPAAPPARANVPGETAFLSPFALPEPALPFGPGRGESSPAVTYGPPPAPRAPTGTTALDPDVLRRVLHEAQGKPGAGR